MMWQKPSETENGVYYVTGKTTDETKATTFIPNAETGKILVNGTEADEYQLTEVATDDGYNLLKDQIVVDITATDRDVIASVAGVTGMDAEAAAEIVKNYHGGIYDEMAIWSQTSWMNCFRLQQELQIVRLQMDGPSERPTCMSGQSNRHPQQSIKRMRQ